jgi:hypothetical protein
MDSIFPYPSGTFSWVIALAGLGAIALAIVATVLLHRTIGRWENRRFRKGMEKSYDKL